MGAPLGLRESIAVAGCQYRLYGSIQTDSIALRDKDRRYPIFRPKDHADLLALIQQQRNAPATCPRLLVRPHWTTLRTPDRGKIEHEAQMTGQSKSARMRETVTITDEAVRHRLELIPSLEDRRYLPERQKAGDVREAYVRSRCGKIQHLTSVAAHNNDAGKHQL